MTSTNKCIFFLKVGNSLKKIKYTKTKKNNNLSRSAVVFFGYPCYYPNFSVSPIQVFLSLIKLPLKYNEKVLEKEHMVHRHQGVHMRGQRLHPNEVGTH